MSVLHGVYLYVVAKLQLWLGLCANFFRIYFRCQKNDRLHQKHLWFSSDEDTATQHYTHYSTPTTEPEAEEQCYICLEPICYQSPTRMLPCSHNDHFHMACLWKWVWENSSRDFTLLGVLNVSCPVCRSVKRSQICNMSGLHRRQPFM